MESFKKGFTYEGEFLNNQRNGTGTARFRDTRLIQNIEYHGEWLSGSMCGKGRLSYQREVKYGRKKEVEKNNLTGMFFNGVYQGRMNSEYLDELLWDLTTPLKSEYFQNFGPRLSEKDLKRKKNLATIDGGVSVSCECRSGLIIFDTNAIFRKTKSWWHSDIPVKTKSIILNTMQPEFDIIEWHARELKNDLNKEQLACNTISLSVARTLIEAKHKESRSVRKAYVDETKWNPKKGGLKNSRVQEKWNNKISKKLKKLKKLNQKTLSKLEKKMDKAAAENCPPYSIDINLSPIQNLNNKNLEMSKTQLIANAEEKIKLSKQGDKKDIILLEKKSAQEKKKAEKKAKEQSNRDKRDKREEDNKLKKLMKEQEREQLVKERAENKQARKLKRSQRSYTPQFPRAKQLE